MKKHNYLNRLAIIILLVVFVPVICISYVFWERSSNELEKGNQVYYEKIVESFANDFGERLTELKAHAINISVGSKGTKSIFWDGSNKFREHVFWYWDAVQELKSQYSHYDASKYGVFYYDLDHIITETGTQTSEQFTYDLGLDEDTQYIKRFLDKANWQANTWIFSSNFNGTEHDSCMLMGYCVELGKNNDRCLIVYTLEEEDYSDSLSVVYEYSGINFYILDNSCENIYLALGVDAEKNVDIVKACSNISEQSGSTAVYYDELNCLPLTFAIYNTENSMQNNVIEFYNDMRMVLFITACVLLFVCALVLYIAYKPIYKLAEELGCSEDVDEFGLIRNVLDERYSKIVEQEMLIMDLLLKHLIWGGPISRKKMERLGIASDINHYCVFMLNGHVLHNNESGYLVKKIEMKFSARLFCTDWPGENKSILITFMKSSDIIPIEKDMNKWLQYYVSEECSLVRGLVVDKLDDIRKSFLYCLEKKKEQFSEKVSVEQETKSLDPKGEQQAKMKDEILEYLEIHFQDEDLNQAKVADEFKISNYTLSRIFKNQVGVGFVEYVNSKRVDYAKELLLTTSLPIQEIYRKAGFSSSTSFYRIFKALVGRLPTSFREE